MGPHNDVLYVYSVLKLPEALLGGLSSKLYEFALEFLGEKSSIWYSRRNLQEFKRIGGILVFGHDTQFGVSQSSPHRCEVSLSK